MLLPFSLFMVGDSHRVLQLELRAESDRSVCLGAFCLAHVCFGALSFVFVRWASEDARVL